MINFLNSPEELAVAWMPFLARKHDAPAAGGMRPSFLSRTPVKTLAAVMLLAIFSLSIPLHGQTDSPGPDSYDQLVLTANSQLKQGQVDAASQTVQQAIRQNPDGYQAYAIAAKVASQQGNAAAVTDDLQKALLHAPDDAAKAKVQQLAALLSKDTAPHEVPSVKTTPTVPLTSPDAPLPRGVYNFNDSQYGNVIMLTCNAFQNVEGDKSVHYPNDFIGVKDTFSANEKVGIYMFTGVGQTGYGIRIWDGGGNLINDYVSKTITGGVSTVFPKLATGNYTAAFYHDGMRIKKIHFSVIN